MVPVGEGVFETLKVVDSQPHAFTRHLMRMATSAAGLGMQIPELEDARQRAQQHLREQPLTRGRLRIEWLATAVGADFVLSSRPLPNPSPAATLVTDAWVIDERGPQAGIKSTRYENFANARQRAVDAGYEDALLVNTAGHLCETSTANIFYVLDGVLCTPTPASGCLPGIARGLVLDLCDVTEIDAPVEVLADASEVFITSSLRDVQPVARVGDQEYPSYGPVTADAIDAWQRLAATTWDPAPNSPEDENTARVR